MEYTNSQTVPDTEHVVHTLLRQYTPPTLTLLTNLEDQIHGGVYNIHEPSGGRGLMGS